MQIFIQQNGKQCGPIAIDQVRAGLANGSYQPTDMAWYEGAAGWLPLAAVPGIAGNAPPQIPGAVPVASTSTLGVWSLVLGVLTFVTCGFTAIPAVICGHLSLGDIKRSGGAKTGGGLALAGLITGYLGFAIMAIAMLSGLAAPMVIRQRKKADQTEAVSNARSFGLALFEFETEYGSFPTDATAKAVAEATDTGIVSGNSSNARFRQLIRAGIVQSETPFYAHIKGTHKPDNDFQGAHALEPGECGFAYVENLLTTDKVARPLAMTPLIPGAMRFDPLPFGGKAVILFTDNSVKSLPIDGQSGKVMFEGKDLLDPAHPIWGGKPPVIVWPE